MHLRRKTHYALMRAYAHICALSSGTTRFLTSTDRTDSTNLANPWTYHLYRCANDLIYCTCSGRLRSFLNELGAGLQTQLGAGLQTPPASDRRSSRHTRRPTVKITAGSGDPCRTLTPPS